MIRSTLLLSLAVALVTVGCAERTPTDQTAATIVGDDGLAIRASADLAVARPGDTITVQVTLENTSGDPIRWTAPNTAPIYVRVQQQSDLEMGLWQDMKVYPEAAGMAITRHSYDPGEKESFTLDIPVEPDWPRGEVVRLAVHPNGRPELAATMNVKIPAIVESDDE